MKQKIYITSVFCRLSLSETIRKKLVGCLPEVENKQPPLPSNLAPVHHSSAEAYISGTVELGYMSRDLAKTGMICVPVSACFLFTSVCCKADLFEEVWNTSLS